MDYQLLALDGVELISRYQLTGQLIASELSPEAASFLAEPVKNLEQGRISWYTSLPGRIRSLKELSPMEQAEALAYGQEMKGKLAVLAEEFLRSSSRTRKLAGGLLTQILKSQDPGRIFLAGDRPVLTGWGLKALAEAGPVQAVQPAAKKIPSPEAAPLRPEAIAVQGRYSFFKILLGAVLGFCIIVLLVFLFFPKLKQLTSHLISPPQLDTAGFDRSRQLEDRLRRELAELRGLYFQKLAACPVPGPAPGPAQSGRPPQAWLPDIKPADLPPSQPEPSRSRNLTIPEGAGKNNDLSFLEGCWTSFNESIRNTVTGRPVLFKYCFDNSGQAQVSIDETDAQGKYSGTCVTTAKASFKGSGLIMTQTQGPKCQDNRTYMRHNLTCTPDSSRTEGGVSCLVEQPGRPSYTTLFMRVNE
ncbi:MAG: hypothetical protein LBK52_04195 [Deltaproteobacteria bacterium]|nr:hypothetical protein [Deltaproteobacteria bacterium]